MVGQCICCRCSDQLRKTLMRRLLSSYPVVITSVFSASLLSAPSVSAEPDDVVYVTAADDVHYEPHGYGALRQSSATKGSAALAETPQFVSVIRRDQLDTLPAESLSKALRFDSTGALNEDETWLYRMTGSAASSGSQIENTKQSRYLIAPSVTWQPLNNLSWTVAGVYQHDPYVGYYNTLPAAALGLLPSPYGSLDRHRNYSNPDHEKSGRTQQSITSLVSWQVSDSLTLKQNLRYADVKTHIRRDFTRGFVQDNRLLTAVYQDSPSRARTLAADNQLIYKTLTGPVSHEILTGFDLQTGKLDKDWSGSQTVTFDPYGSHYRPQFTPHMTSSTSTGQTYRRYGVYMQDHLRWQQWSLILSGRYDDSSLKTTNNLSGTTQNSDTSAYSHRAGLTYTFTSPNNPSPE
ncbi:TonB-dependent receptor [Morganella morganii]|nr:TonB-dependent receptor [Morganella morganii]